VGLIQWFKGFDGVEQFLYATAAVSTLWFGLALAIKAKKEAWFREYGEALFVAVWLALIIRATLVEVYSIPSESMVPTLLVEDHLVVSKLTFGWHIPFTHGRVLEFKKPKRGDIVIFVPPSSPQQSFVKRCVGIPGDVIEVRDKILFVNGHAADFQTSYGFLRYQTAPGSIRPALQSAYQQLQAENSKEWGALRDRITKANGEAYAQELMRVGQVHKWKGPFDAGKGSYIVGCNALQTIIGARLLDGKNAGDFQTDPQKFRDIRIYGGLGNHDWFGPLKLEAGQ